MAATAHRLEQLPEDTRIGRADTVGEILGGPEDLPHLGWVEDHTDFDDMLMVFVAVDGDPRPFFLAAYAGHPTGGIIVWAEPTPDLPARIDVLLEALGLERGSFWLYPDWDARAAAGQAAAGG